MVTIHVTTPGEREVVFTRDFNAPRRLLFECWTRPELLKRWLYGPEKWKLETCEIDLRVGGKLRFVWRSDTDTGMGMSGVYREIVRDERLVFTELFDEDWTEGEALVTLTFEEHEGKTTQRQKVLYSSRAARDGAMQTDMVEGMKMGDERLEKLLATMEGAP